ncbi:MAG: UbiX family flavin prenyltransferase [Spirochaetes bacterium]|nr:UbiX family flavin prenyltransferase [Spirochaetota bacterium]
MMYIVGITGASGVIYGIRLVEELLASGKKTAVIASRTALLLSGEELYPGNEFHSVRDILAYRNVSYANLVEYANDDLFAPISSGSVMFDGIAIVPCSMKTLGKLACGIDDTLMLRAFGVALKERRKAVIVPRETPLSEIHLTHMLRLTRAGAIVLPPMPAFYHKPQTVDDMVNFVVGKILQTLGITHHLFRAWGNV